MKMTPEQITRLLELKGASSSSETFDAIHTLLGVIEKQREALVSARTISPTADLTKIYDEALALSEPYVEIKK